MKLYAKLEKSTILITDIEQRGLCYVTDVLRDKRA